MCVKELVLELEGVLNKIDKAFQDIKNEKSRLDLLREDILHFLEGDIFNASQGYKYAKALQKIQNERRIISNEYYALQVLNDKIRSVRNQIQQATYSTIKKANELEKISELGVDAYNPRILKSASKDDILNQVICILNEEE